MWLCFFFRLKTAYAMRISDWSSEGCSSDLHEVVALDAHLGAGRLEIQDEDLVGRDIQHDRLARRGPRHHERRLGLAQSRRRLASDEGGVLGSLGFAMDLVVAAQQIVGHLSISKNPTRRPTDRKSTRLNSSH